jgi:hypothetical protein
MGNQRQQLAEISRIAAGQHGHITRVQLRAIGLSERTIDRRIQSGALIRVHAGVYAVGYLRVEPVARAAAAVLACGDAPCSAMSPQLPSGDSDDGRERRR